LCFARDHLGKDNEERLRRVPSGTHDVFSPEPSSATERRDVRLARFKVDDEKTKVILMVQRLSGEKGTERIFPVFAPKDVGGEAVGGVLAIAGDGPSKAALMAEAKARQLRVVFLGNVPHHELPELYRAADCFVTMSLSETFGLTCLEAMMCGCPAVMPYCDVFNEIWDDKVPKTWRYDIASVSGLAAAIASAQDGRDYLSKHPVNMTWRMASNELLTHYEECIKFKASARRSLYEMVHVMDHCLRVAIFGLLAAWILGRYYAMLARFGSMFSQ